MVASITVPYRIDLRDPPDDALDTLVELGALDIESVDGGLAALLPDTVPAADLASSLGRPDVRVSPAMARDDGSVWTLNLRPVRTRTLTIVPASMPLVPGALRIGDGPAFGSGLHPTTVLCLEAIEDLLDVWTPARMLDVGTGSGILALAALHRGVPTAVGIDVDAEALDAAAGNGGLNDVAGRLSLVHGTVDAVGGLWPLVVANLRAAELIELAPSLARRVASGGRLVLSGIPTSIAADVEQAYRRRGMKQVSSAACGGWIAFVVAPTW